MKPSRGLIPNPGPLLLAGAVVCGVGSSRAAEVAEPPEPPLTVTTELDLVSRYVWRGLPFSPGAALQPSLALAVDDFTFTTWANADLDSATRTQRWNEVDLTLNYVRSWGHWILGGTVQSYLYPCEPEQPNTAEVMVQVGYEWGEFQLMLQQTVDVAAYPGGYYGELVPGWKRDLGSGLELAITAPLAWTTEIFTRAYAGAEASGLYLVSAEAALRWSWSPSFVVRPHVGVSHRFMDASDPESSAPDFVWVGLALTLELP